MGVMENETTEQKWAARIVEWRASGLSARVYCEGRGFRASTLHQWSHVLKRRGLRSDATARLVRLVRVERATAPSPAIGASMTIELSGARLVVPSGFDASTVRAVLEALSIGPRGARR